MKKILLIGKNGQVGFELLKILPKVGSVLATDKEMLNLADPKSIKKLIEDFKPDIIINAAAYTAVDLAEDEKELAFQINAKAPEVLMECAKKQNALFIHYSTDYVFDGKSSLPYVEESPTHPLNIYGQSKLQGEKAIFAMGGNHFIFRTSWVYGLRGKNFFLTMLKLAKEKDHLNIVADQIGAPTTSASLAEATFQVLNYSKEELDGKYGLYHMSCLGKTSWHDFAKALFECEKKKDPFFKVPQLSQISSSQYPLKAERPGFSVLSNEKLKRTFNIQLPSWQEALHALKTRIC